MLSQQEPAFSSQWELPSLRMLFPCPPLCASLPRGPGLPLPLPLGLLLLPLGYNTNHPVPAGHREPPNPPHFLGGSLACTPNYLRPWGWGAAWGSRWLGGLGDSCTSLGQILLSFLYLNQAWSLRCPQ